MEYFNTLGVSPLSNIERIKEVYRLKLKVCHPDKGNSNGSEFIKLKHAYDKVIDIINKCDIRFNKLLNPNLLKSDSIGENVEVNLYITLDELFQGTNGYVVYSKRTKKSFTFEKSCKCCYGHGFVINETSINKNESYYTLERCNKCIFDNDNYEIKNKSLTVCIPAFFYEKQYIYEGEGNEIWGGTSGDLIINVKIKNDGIFQIVNYNLYTTVNLKLRDALCGFSIIMYHPNGSLIKIESEEITKPSEFKVFHGLGLKQGNKYGYLRVDFNIQFPDKISDEARELIKRLI